MSMFRKVAIIGVGLIGGSIGLAIKKKKLAKTIAGVSRHKESLSAAKKKGAIDSGSCSLDIIKGADLVILATPVNTIIELAPKIACLVSKDCLVTDVGSTKEEVNKRLSGIFPNYLGSHPLAGSEKRGVANARADLFRGSLCILTPLQNTNRRGIEKIKLLWRSFGARVILLSPVEHDKILSFVSHLAHIAAFSLIAAVPGEYFKFASSGLKDTTRIAASESELWADIFLSNRRNILEAMNLLEGDLSRIREAIAKKDKRGLAAILQHAAKKRKALANL